MQELEAMNVLLRAIGSSPVNSLNSPQPDAANARATLTRNRRKAQLRGWWFNIDYRTVFYKDSSNEITIPEEISSITFDENVNIVKRGKRLYDSFRNSYKFDDSVTSHTSIRILPWEELPESMQEYVTYTSAAEFVRDEIEDRSKEETFKQDAALAMIAIKKEDLAAGQYNTFDKSRVRRARAGQRPYDRSSRFEGTPDH